MSVPWNERGGTWRGVIDLMSGRLPRFLFGSSVGSLVPVFHFHDEPREALEPAFGYLRDNGYRTVTADDLSAVARGRRRVGDREVALCFDDAWQSVWTDAAPLLRRYDLTAIVYPIPGRLTATADAGAFMNWSQLRALHSEGLIDVQSHTWLHARIFTAHVPLGFVSPGYETRPLLNRPLLQDSPHPHFIGPTELGAPLYEDRSRMSDGRRRERSTGRMRLYRSVISDW